MAEPTLSEKAARFESDLHERHDFEGLVLPSVLLPPLGRTDFQTGNEVLEITGEAVSRAARMVQRVKG